MSLQVHLIKLLLPIQFRNWSKLGFAEMRAKQQGGSRFVRLPAGTVTKPVDAGGAAAEWMRAARQRSGLLRRALARA